MNRPATWASLRHSLTTAPLERGQTIGTVGFAAEAFKTGPPDDGGPSGKEEPKNLMPQAISAKLARNASRVASMSASLWAREVKPASKALGAR